MSEPTPIGAGAGSPPRHLVSEDIDSLLTQAQEKYKVKKELCDSEGFYQHLGECWHDAFQMILFFADTYKEITQPFFINNKITKELILHNSLGNLDAKPEDFPELSNYTELFRIYFERVQRRFLRHYLMESERKNILATCDPGGEPGETAKQQLLNIAGKYRQRGKNAVESAFLVKFLTKEKETKETKEKALKKRSFFSIVPFVQNPNTSLFNKAEENYAKYKKNIDFRGGNWPEEKFMESVFNIIIQQGVNPRKIFKNAFTNSNPLLSNIKQYSAVYISSFLTSTGYGHALCGYVCGNIQYFYEDNYGPFAMPWQELFYTLKTYDLNKNFYKYIYCAIYQNGSLIKSTKLYPCIYLGETDEIEIFVDGDSQSHKFTIDKKDTYVNYTFEHTSKNNIIYKFNGTFELHTPSEENTDFTSLTFYPLFEGMNTIKNQSTATLYSRKAADNINLELVLSSDKIKTYESLLRKGYNPSQNDILYMISVYVESNKDIGELLSSPALALDFTKPTVLFDHFFSILYINVILQLLKRKDINVDWDGALLHSYLTGNYILLLDEPENYSHLNPELYEKNRDGFRTMISKIYVELFTALREREYMMKPSDYHNLLNLIQKMESAPSNLRLSPRLLCFDNSVLDKKSFEDNYSSRYLKKLNFSNEKNIYTFAEKAYETLVDFCGKSYVGEGGRRCFQKKRKTRRQQKKRRLTKKGRR